MDGHTDTQQWKHDKILKYRALTELEKSIGQLCFSAGRIDVFIFYKKYST